MKEIFLSLESEAAKVGVKINEDKTKYIIKHNRDLNAGNFQKITIGEYNLERVPNFKYLGYLLTNNSENKKLL